MSPQWISYLVTFLPDMATSKTSPAEINSPARSRNLLGRIKLIALIPRVSPEAIEIRGSAYEWASAWVSFCSERCDME